MAQLRGRSELRQKFGALRFVALIFLAIATLLAQIAQSRDKSPFDFGQDGGPEASWERPEPKPSPFESVESAGRSAVLREDDPATDPADLLESDNILPERYLNFTVPWQPPAYGDQEGALGWTPTTFEVTENLRERVQFWESIYSNYTSDQGVLHDVDNVKRIYDLVDFTAIVQNTSLSPRAKARARTRLLKEKRTSIQNRLKKLANMKSQSLSLDEKDRELLALFTPLSIAELFQKENKKALGSLKTTLEKAASKRRIRFQLGQKDKFILGIYYSGRYLKEMERIFRNEGLPVELTRLPFVESSFNIKARSRVGASGIWQFMPRTAKTWLMLNRDVDERNDPLAATRAAAQLMKANYNRLQTWPLALTAYNHGASGLARAIRKTKSRDIGVIVEKYESRRFGFASSNFYACFLAAINVEKRAKELFGDVKWSPEFSGKEIELEGRLSWKIMLEVFDGDLELTILQNPHINSQVRAGKRDIPAGTFVRVPVSRAGIFQDFLAEKLTESELRGQIALAPLQPPSSEIKEKVSSDFLKNVVKSVQDFFVPSPSPNPQDTGLPGQRER